MSRGRAAWMVVAVVVVGAAVAGFVVVRSPDGGNGHRGPIFHAQVVVGAPSSPYWIAGWKPSREHLVAAEETDDASGRSFDAAYGTGPSPHGASDFDIEVRHDSTSCKASGSAVLVRGHPSCEGSNYDDGSNYGWNVSWEERPGLSILIDVNGIASVPQARAVARRIAAHVEPVTPATWRMLERMTTEVPVSVMHRVQVEQGEVGGHEWVLDALVPPEYPLTVDDHRTGCIELHFRGLTARCDETGRGVVTTLAGTNFVFGTVPNGVRNIALSAYGFTSPAPSLAQVPPPRRPFATVRTVVLRGLSRPYFASEVPKDVCAVRADDVRGRVRYIDGFSVDGHFPCRVS
jgi:hypothetical protein